MAVTLQEALAVPLAVTLAVTLRGLWQLPCKKLPCEAFGSYLARGYDQDRGLAVGYGHTHQNTPDLV